MKKAAHSILTAIAAMALFLSGSVVFVGAADASQIGSSALPGAIGNNVSHNDYYEWSNWAQPVRSYLVQNADQTLTRVEYIENHETGAKKILVETYSSDGKTLKSTKTVSQELPLFGGFFSGETYNFFVFGQANPQYNDKTEVVRIVKYSKAWKRLAAVSVYGANTSTPFRGGSVRMAEYGGKLFLHTCHEMYPVDGVIHQANMTFSVDEETNKIVRSNTEISNIATGYVSHSFNQFVAAESGTLYRVDHGDAHPRGISIVKSSADSITSCSSTIAVDLSKTGEIGDNRTGASVGGFELAGSNCLIAGNVVNYQNYDTAPDDTRNIFVSVTNKNLGSTAVKMLTSYTSKSNIAVSNPHLVKISENKLLVIWEEANTKTEQYYTKMAAIDASGNRTSAVYTNDYYLSDCKPILCADGMVRWYAGTGNEELLYTVDPSDLSASANDLAQADIYCTKTVNVVMQIGDRYHLNILDNVSRAGLSWSVSGVEYDSKTHDLVAASVSSGPFTVTAYEGRGTFEYNYHITVYLPTPAISSAAVVSGGMKLTWKPVQGAENYRVFVKNGSYWKALATVDGKTTSYLDKTAKLGGTYTYTIRCVDEYGKYVSAYDKTGCTVHYLTTPKITKCTNVNGGTVVAWSASSGAAKYRVFVKSGTSWKVLANVTGTTYTHKIASSGASYTYTVRCISSDLKNYESAYDATGVTNKYIAAPAGLACTNVNGGTKISWSASSGAAKYRVFVKSGSSWKALADVAGTSYTHKIASSGGSYTYTVRCLSADAKRYVSGFNTKGITNKYVAAPVLSGVKNTSKGVVVTYSVPNGASGFRVYRKTASSGWTKIGDVGPAVKSFTDTTAKNGVKYTYTVRCISADRKTLESAYDTTGVSITCKR